MKRAASAVLRQMRQGLPQAVGQFFHGYGRGPFADQRQIDPALDVCAQQTDAFQFQCGSFFQQFIDLNELRLYERDHRVHQPIFFLDLRTLAFQLVFRPDQLIFFRQLRVDFR